jgi:PAS domain S-box-containing protein
MTPDVQRENERYFAQIADNIREFIWLSDVEFTTHYYVNSAYERIWGRTRESLYNDPASLLEGVHEDDRERVRLALRGMPHGNYEIEFRVVRPDGDVRWVSSRGVPVRDAGGQISRIAGITEDITDRKHAEAELARIIESRTGLIRGFTHDIKNPLGAADGFLALLTDGIYGEITSEQSESIAKARRAIGSALTLINHLLELARAESGQLEIRTEPTDVRDTVLTIAEAFRAQAEAKGLSLAVELPPMLPEIQTDRARMQQVLGNLVSNAVKYTRRGGHITIRASAGARQSASRSDESIVIEVTDNGSGITPENQRRLFQEFTRFSPGAAHGAGIGLAISQRIAHALGGAITVESELGVGSTFSLRLPSGEIQREENPILFSNHAENHAEITSGKRHP